MLICTDMYGKGKTGNTRKKTALMTPLMETVQFAKRIIAAFDG